MSNPGWSCPKCGSVYAPWVRRCEECPKGTLTGANATEPVVIGQEGQSTCRCPTEVMGFRVHNSTCPLFREGTR